MATTSFNQETTLKLKNKHDGRIRKRKGSREGLEKDNRTIPANFYDDELEDRAKTSLSIKLLQIISNTGHEHRFSLPGCSVRPCSDWRKM